MAVDHSDGRALHFTTKLNCATDFTSLRTTAWYDIPGTWYSIKINHDIPVNYMYRFMPSWSLSVVKFDLSDVFVLKE